MLVRKVIWVELEMRGGGTDCQWRTFVRRSSKDCRRTLPGFLKALKKPCQPGPDLCPDEKLGTHMMPRGSMEFLMSFMTSTVPCPSSETRYSCQGKRSVQTIFCFKRERGASSPPSSRRRRRVRLCTFHRAQSHARPFGGRRRRPLRTLLGSQIAARETGMVSKIPPREME